MLKNKKMFKNDFSQLNTREFYFENFLSKLNILLFKKIVIVVYLMVVLRKVGKEKRSLIKQKIRNHSEN